LVSLVDFVFVVVAKKTDLEQVYITPVFAQIIM